MSEANSREAIGELTSLEQVQHNNETDLTKVREMCSKAITELFVIMGKLEEIRSVVDAIQIPELSSYVHVSKLPTITATVTSREEKQTQSKIETKTETKAFTPTKKETGDPLKELLYNMSNMKQSDVSKLIDKLNTNK